MAQVLLVGASGSGKWALQSALVTAAGGNLVHPSLPGEHERAAERGIVPWRIDNKYYSVDTQLSVISAEASSTAPDLSAQGFTEPEALVLVLNSTQPATFAAVQEWHAVHNCEDAGVRLVVATHADRLDQTPGEDGMEALRPPWLEQAIEWTVEQQFEYVECCCTDSVVDSKLRLYGEPQGVTRVVEALHAHMWPGLTRKPSIPAAAAAAPAAAAASPTSTAAPTSTQQVPSQQGPPQPAVSESESAALHDSRPAGNGSANGQKHDLDEHKMDSYERLMDDMAAAKQRLSGCDDAARRAGAAELALRFASLLGGSDSDEDLSDTSDV